MPAKKELRIGVIGAGSRGLVLVRNAHCPENGVRVVAGADTNPAALAQFNRSRSQGASTITMQVARNFYLSTEKTYTRKIYEMLLAFKMENALSKDQILEVYMNQIFLGQRAYGFAAANAVERVKGLIAGVVSH